MIKEIHKTKQHTSYFFFFYPIQTVNLVKLVKLAHCPRTHMWLATYLPWAGFWGHSWRNFLNITTMAFGVLQRAPVSLPASIAFNVLPILLTMTGKIDSSAISRQRWWYLTIYFSNFNHSIVRKYILSLCNSKLSEISSKSAFNELSTISYRHFFQYADYKHQQQAKPNSSK